MSTPDKNIKRKYSLSDYNPVWVEQFHSIKQFLSDVFGAKAIAIEHIGSTSIPGMKAKPLIDVLVVINHMEEFAEEKQKMVAAGYEWGENYIEPNTLIFYKMATDGSKTQNIHVCPKNAYKTKQFIVKRDYLRAFPDKAKQYSDIKEQAFKANPHDYPGYRATKEPFLNSIEQEAFDWFAVQSPMYSFLE